MSAFWGYNYSYTDNGVYYPNPIIFIIYEDDVQVPNVQYFSIEKDGITYIPFNIPPTPGYDHYHEVPFLGAEDPLPFDFNDQNISITLAPGESFFDSQNNPFAANYTLPVELPRSPKILHAETSEERYIILTLDRYVTGVEPSDFSISDSLSVQNVNISDNKLILDVGSMQGDTAPTVTITGTITDKSDSDWDTLGYIHNDIVVGTVITAIDGSSPTILTAEYDNLYNLTLTYTEPIDVSTLDETDFQTFYDIQYFIPDSDIKKITNIDTATDGLSSILTFDKKLNPDGNLTLIGSVYMLNGIYVIPSFSMLKYCTLGTCTSSSYIINMIGLG